MMKRKNGVKKIVMMVMFMLILIINFTLPAFATATNNTCEITILEDFVVRVENLTEETKTLTIKIVFFDSQDEIINTKKVEVELDAHEIKTFDHYYNTEKISRITADIISEKLTETISTAKKVRNIFIVVGIISFVLTVVFIIVDNANCGVTDTCYCWIFIVLDLICFVGIIVTLLIT